MAGDVSAPLRVGLFPSVGRFGLHLIERFADGGPFRVVAASDPLIPAHFVEPFGVRLMCSPQELAQADDIDVLWRTSFDEFRAEFAPTELLFGKHTIVETPLTVTTEMAGKTLGWAAESQRLLLVHHPRRADLDFRQALALAQDASLGAIRAAKFISWSYGLPPRGATRGHGPLSLDASEDPQVTKVRFVAHALDQMVALIRVPPVRVLAVGAPDLFAGYSLSLHLVFESGCEADIDVRLDSPAAFQSGWMMTGERGGYAHGRQYTRTDEGEVFDAPVVPLISDADADQFEWLARQIRSGERNHAEVARVRTVVALLDAAQRSLATRQVVNV
jgi:predicted dehydrogenase